MREPPSVPLTPAQPWPGTPPADDPDATVVRPGLQPDPDATVRQPTRSLDPDATRVVPLATRRQDPGSAELPPLPAGLRRPPLALPSGLQLMEYRIDRVLGQGGFGITYLATDVHLNAPVAIKEYLPESIAFRAGDRSVSPNASSHRDRYQQGLESFLVEARTLAGFRHPAIVRVARFFEAHRTAYMVLEYEAGSPLRTAWPAQAQSLGEAGLLERLLPLLDGLTAVHAAGFLHRDIKPDNIQVRAADESWVLLDFGSAGQAAAVTDAAAVVLTPGYAPIEQYGLGEQGPWTDVYALGATLYWAVTGHKPPDAEQRAADPACMPAAVQVGAGRYSPAFLRAIDAALEPDPRARLRDVAALRRALCAAQPAQLRLHDALHLGDSGLDPAPDQPAAQDGGRAGWLRRLRGVRAAAKGAVRAGRVARPLRTRWQPRDWPLALKLSLALVSTALLPMGLTGLDHLHRSVAALTRAEQLNLELLAHGTAQRMAQFVADAAHTARALASDPHWAVTLAPADGALAAAAPGPETRSTTSGSAGPGRAAWLAAVAAADPDLDGVALLDAQGEVLASSPGLPTDVAYAGLPGVQSALQGQPGRPDLLPGRGVGDPPGLLVSAPLAAADAAAVPGVLLMHLRGSALARILDSVSRDAALTPVLLDGQGRVLLAGVGLGAQQARFEPLRDLALARAVQGLNAVGHVAYGPEGGFAAGIAGHAPVSDHDWLLVIRQPLHSFEAPMDDLRRQLAWSASGVGAVFLVLALLLARGIVQPMRAVTAAAEALKAGDYTNARVAVHSRDEVGQLARTFNVMVDVLRQREREHARR